MIVLMVSITIKEGFKDQFMDSLMGDAIGSNNDEPGCYRFDVIQDNEVENLIHLYEVYHDQAAVDAHRAAPHYEKWRAECEPWFDGEIVRKIGAPVYPPVGKWNKRPRVD